MYEGGKGGGHVLVETSQLLRERPPLGSFSESGLLCLSCEVDVWCLLRRNQQVILVTKSCLLMMFDGEIGFCSGQVL